MCLQFIRIVSSVCQYIIILSSVKPCVLACMHAYVCVCVCVCVCVYDCVCACVCRYHDGGRPSDGERSPFPTVHSSQLPRDCVPRREAVLGRYAGHVQPAQSEGPSAGLQERRGVEGTGGDVERRREGGEGM